MATFPAGIFSPTNPTPLSPRTSPTGPAELVTALNAEVVAIETLLGVNGSNAFMLTFNVRYYGAAGDGVTDDTAAINAAITACLAAGGGIVYFPPGRYFTADASQIIHDAGVSLVGVNEYAAWGATPYGTAIVCDATRSNALVSVPAGTNFWSIKGIAFSTTSGTTTAPCINVGGTSGAQCSHTTLKNIVATGVGGITASYLNRSVIEDVVLQTYESTNGFSLTNCSIVYFNRTNAAPAGSGTGTSYLFTNCATIVSTGCEANGSPLHALQFSGTNDSTFFDFEGNGATGSECLITGCTDIVFNRIYFQVSGPTHKIEIVNSSIIQFHGGWLDNPSGSTVLIDGTGGATHDIIFDGIRIDPANTTDPIFSITSSNVFNVVINGNNINPTNASPVLVNDASTFGARVMSFVGNTVAHTTNPATFVAGTFTTGRWSISANSGFDPHAPQTITATNMAWPVPPGAQTLRVTAVGGGGGGGGSAGSSPSQIGAAGGGGGAGQMVTALMPVGGAATLNATIGAGAAGGIAGTINQGANGGSGASGSATSLANATTAQTITAGGGGGAGGGSTGTGNGANGGSYGHAGGSTSQAPGFGSAGGGSNATASTSGAAFGYSGSAGAGGGGANAGTANGAGGGPGTLGGGGTTGGAGGGGGTQTGGNAAANSGAGGGGGGGTQTVATTGAIGAGGGNGGSGYLLIEVVD